MSKPRVATITSGDGDTFVIRLAAIRLLVCKTIPGKPMYREITIHTDCPTVFVLNVTENVAKVLVENYSAENWE